MVKYEIIDLPIIAIIGKEGVGTKEKNHSFLKGGLKGMFIADMIAPCGLDCSICKRALAETGPCAGCSVRS